MKNHSLAFFRVHKGKGGGMQCVTGENLYLRPELRVFYGKQSGSAAVNFVPNHRMPQTGQVYANLMSSPCLDLDFQKGRRGKPFTHFPQREGISATPAFGGHFFAVHGVASYRPVYLAGEVLSATGTLPA